MALRSRPAGGGFKPPTAALAEDCLVNTNVEVGLVVDGEPTGCGAVRVMEVVWPSGIALQEEVSNQRALRPLTAVRGERHVERRASARQVWSGKMVGNICRRRVEISSVDIGTRVGQLPWDKPGRYLFTAQAVSGVQAA
jgi:hypothetical protein